MAINFTCPHCGKRATRVDLTENDVEYVDLGNGLPDAVFPALAAGAERHIDTRICCADCYARAGVVATALGKTHPYDPKTHADRLASIAPGTTVNCR